MNQTSALVIAIFLVVTMACSEPRCPPSYVQDGKICRRCPDGTAAIEGHCFNEAGVVVDRSDDGGGDSDLEGDRDGEENPSEDARAPVGRDGTEPGRSDGGAQLPSESPRTASDAEVLPIADSAIGTDATAMRDAAPTHDAAATSVDAGATSTCTSNVDCGTAGASRCAAGACTTCQADADCSHVGGRIVCLQGTCVQCTRDKAAACTSGGTQYVCDPSSHACDMNRRARSKGLCNVCTSSTDSACAARPDCISDDECQTGQVCVMVAAGGSRRVCQAIKTVAACPLPYGGITRTPVPSADGQSVTVCTFRWEQTTCQAHADFRSKPCGVPDVTMPGGQAPDHERCGEPGVADGICVYAPEFTEYRCTVPCGNTVEDCPLNSRECDRTNPNNFCSL